MLFRPVDKQMGRMGRLFSSLKGLDGEGAYTRGPEFRPVACGGQMSATLHTQLDRCLISLGGISSLLFMFAKVRYAIFFTLPLAGAPVMYMRRYI